MCDPQRGDARGRLPRSATLPRMSRNLRGALTSATIVASGIVPAFLLYSHTLAFGFDYDDYHFVRPFSRADLAAAFRGPWDSSGIELPYYRPLTIAAYAARFAWFGINSPAHHAASVAAFAIAAALAGFVAWGFTGRRLAGVLTAVIFAVHPAMPYALVSWITNQMHLLEITVILMALAWWNGVRTRPIGWWLPLWLFATAAFLVKEDGIMLLPAILALHWLRRRSSESTLQRIPLPFVLGSAAVIAVLLAVRGQALAEVRGRSLPSIAQGFTNYVSGMNHVFRLVPADRPWQQAASWFATILPVAGLLAAWRKSSGTRYGIVAGLATAAAFNLPFVLITKGEQMHVVATGAVFVLAAAAVSILDALRHRVLKAAAWMMIAGGICAFAAVSRDISSDFRPLGPIVRSHDAIVRGWAAVPEEMREYLARKNEPGGAAFESNPAAVLETVTFGVQPAENSPSGMRYHWMSGATADILVNAGARAVTIPLRHEMGAFQEVAEARITVDGKTLDRIRFPDGDWRFSRIALSPATVSSLFAMHRITVRIDHPWVPSTVVPGSADSRTLGLQIGPVEVR